LQREEESYLPVLQATFQKILKLRKQQKDHPFEKHLQKLVDWNNIIARIMILHHDNIENNIIGE
jgi:hypothetical protein